jgi:uncharacterized membrane protein YdbT with pleckstrin-like domain
VLESAVAVWLAAVGAGVAAGILSSRFPKAHLGAVGGWIVLGGAAWLAWKAWAWWVARYVITEDRVLFIEGVLNRRVRAIPLSTVTHTDFRRSVPGRILGYGNLTLDAPGEAHGLREMTSIPRPDEVYRLVMSLVAGAGSRGSREERSTISDPAAADTGPLPRLIL